MERQLADTDVRAVLIGPDGASLWGLTPAQRFARAFGRVGITDILNDVAALPEEGRAVLVRADHVYDQRILSAAPGLEPMIVTGAATDDPAAMAPVLAVVEGRAQAEAAARALLTGTAEAAGLPVRTVADLDVGYNKELRKKDIPLLADTTRVPLREIEWRMFRGAYKGATDLVTKWAWPVPAFHVTRWLAPLGVTPNMVTFVSFLFVFVALWCFWNGDFGWGLLAGWFMTFLDTVDGKLARVTLTSSFWGNIFDHGIDLIHPPFWYWAWWHGAAATAGFAVGEPLWTQAFMVILAGYVLSRVIEGLFIHGWGFHIHVWRPIDFAFRTITARRNPNVVILMLFWIAGAPDWGLVAVAAWTLISLLFHTVRLLQACVVRLSGGQVRPWLSA